MMENGPKLHRISVYFQDESNGDKTALCLRKLAHGAGILGPPGQTSRGFTAVQGPKKTAR